MTNNFEDFSLNALLFLLKFPEWFHIPPIPKRGILQITLEHRFLNKNP
jgi:hypothetical protein